MKKGFTLVELLAVIVILAIILAIAIPGISNVIESSKKGAAESNAKMVLKALEFKTLETEGFDPTTITEENIETELGLDATNYKSVDIMIEDGNPKIIIVGQNKWDGLVIYGTYYDITSSDMPQGLIGHWKMNGNANDSSSSGVNGTVTGATLTTDQYGRPDSAYHFDGTNDYISLNKTWDQLLGGVNANFTISFWFKYDVNDIAAGNRFSMMGTNVDSVDYGIWIGPSDGGILDFRIRGSNSGSNIVICGSTENVGDDNWHFAAITVNRSGNADVYIDGQLGRTCSIVQVTGSLGDVYVKIGKVVNSFIGDLDDIRIYNRILSSDEITVLKNTGQ